MTTPLEDYALLSDMRTAALVSKEGSIDWLCVPRFDSQAVFTALLGTEEHGHWTIEAPGGHVSSRRYIGDSFVLETTWTTPTGVATVTDFMPIDPGTQQYRFTDMMRVVHCLSGTVDIRTALRLRFDYGRATPYYRYWVNDPDENIGEILSVAGPDSLHLIGPYITLNEDSNAHLGEFTLQEGDQLEWVLTWFPSHLQIPSAPDYSKARDITRHTWESWAAGNTYTGEYQEEVKRSLLVLKALTDARTGGIVAAPTTSLPEEFGGQRNWDYRYVWLRDSAWTLEVLVESGFIARATDWRDWLLRAIAGDSKQLRIMYGLRGERHLPEFELDHLPGYEDSRPVRIGNGAAEQYQADVVGEVMIALETLRNAGIDDDEFSWDLQKSILAFQEEMFDAKDHGIWEMRSAPAYFTHGRAMMWAAFDRGIKAVENHGLTGPVERWRELREALRDEILTHGWNDQLQSFTQTYGSTAVDASLLQLAQVGFLPYTDPRMLATVDRIEKELLSDDGFLHRYPTGTGVDGIAGEEYPFLLCSFWLIEQYAHSGRLTEACEMMQRILAVSSDLGLLAEEYSPTNQRLAGNYPQAFSHLGLIRAAAAISHPETPVDPEASR
ncbi:glycoside hydrolase family 15 protein [Corynebacterium hylobatis]|uniref:Glycoside hydrolase family 15 protein n=1 Tax=Corynebacterium hylobatis TaxID=1859290 RepID=A0A430HUI6_9CORY|nr:glycoside hydrolase family 15 protein [Corynebacterium hylobatis]RSZ61233.1 glycoside hydrolase family 15 protein [Corynebacterium hylobatis]